MENTNFVKGPGLFAIAIIAGVLMLGLFIRFMYRLIRYQYIGNVYLYIGAAFVICLMMSLTVNFNPIPINVTYDKISFGGTIQTIEDNTPNVSTHFWLITVFISILDSLRMMALAFDKGVIVAYFNQGDWMYSVFGAVYYVVSAFAIGTTIISVIIFFAKTLIAKAINLLKALCPNKTIYYIFSEAKVGVHAKRLARVLKERKQIVVMYVSRDSLKTQEGNEYRDSLINEGFDVRAEAFSPKLCKYIFQKYFKRNFGINKIPFYWKRKITVYGLFSNDEASIELAVNFKRGIVENSQFYKNYCLLWGETANIYLNNDNRFKKIKEKVNKKRPLIFEMKNIDKRINEIEALLGRADVSDEEKAKLGLEKESLEKKKEQLIPLYNEFIAKEKKKGETLLNYLEKYHIFITYQDYDFDLVQDFSSQTLHIVNTLSQYDMVSAEFIFNNPITNFLRKVKETTISSRDNEKPKTETREIIELNKENEDAFHVSFLGYGNINRPIFEKMTYAYQLWPDLTHKIHYHIYDYNSKKLVEKIENEYVNKVISGEANEYFEKPLLYHVNAELDGKDLTDYEILDNHFKELMDKDINPQNYKNRFNSKGFEIFVISAKSTNTDIQIATQLRNILTKRLSPAKLSRTFIFVRVGSDGIKNNILKDGVEKYVFHQKNYEQALANSEGGAPIILFGENTNMAEFIDHDYKRIIKLGLAAAKAYSPQKSDYDIKLEWLQSNKLKVLSNTCSFYSLPTKLELIGYRLDFGNTPDKNGKLSYKWNIVNKDGVILTKDNFNVFKAEVENMIKEIGYPDHYNEKAQMAKLAELEHNRWSAANYLLFHSAQMKKSTFANENDDHYHDIKKRYFITSLHDKAWHVCMTTNKGLRDLYTFLKIDQHPINKDIAIKLVFENDLNQMVESFKTITELDEK